jgi:hypothetical protein
LALTNWAVGLITGRIAEATPVIGEIIAEVNQRNQMQDGRQTACQKSRRLAGAFMPNFRRFAVILEARLVWAAIFIAFFAYVAVRLGTDATSDFKNYHYYNGYAAISDRFSLDIVPADLQTFLYPGLDAAYYLLFHALNFHPILLNVVLSLPYAAAAYLTFLIGDLVVARNWPLRRAAAGLAALYGLIGVASLPTLATTMSDVVPGVFALAALWIWLRSGQQNKNMNLTAALAGGLSGLSVALKLTTVPLFAALGLAIWLLSLTRHRPIAALLFYVAAGLAVVLLLDGRWLLHNYVVYGNPLFPSFNNIFKSDFAAHISWVDNRFKPKTVLMALFYPAYWAVTQSHHAIELNMRDPRILLGLVSAVAILGATLTRNKLYEPDLAPSYELPNWQLAVFFMAAYAWWEFAFSIYRYLAIPECLTGVMVLGALRVWPGSKLKPAWAIAVFCMILAASAGWTTYPWWERAIPVSQALQIKLPEVEDNAMIVRLDHYHGSYLVPSLPATVHVIGADTWIAGPGTEGKLHSQVAAAITDYRGPIWGIEDPAGHPGRADQTLLYYHLSRSHDCVLVEINIEVRKIQMCRLMRF